MTCCSRSVNLVECDEFSGRNGCGAGCMGTRLRDSAEKGGGGGNRKATTLNFVVQRSEM